MHADWRARLAAPPCYERPMDLASAAMKTILGAALLGGSLFALGGCGVGTYHIPNVAPVVKQPPKTNSLLDDTSTDEPKPEEKSDSSGDKKPAP
jgi:hypothetical protein